MLKNPRVAPELGGSDHVLPRKSVADLLADIEDNTLSAEMRARDVLSDGAVVTKATVHGGRLEGCPGYGVRDGVLKLDVEYSPEGAGPGSILVKRWDSQQDQFVDAAIRHRCIVCCCTCGPCADACGCTCIGWGDSTCCVPNRRTKHDEAVLKNWDLNYMIKTEVRFYLEALPLLRKQWSDKYNFDTAPSFITPTLYAGGFHDAGPTHVHTCGFCLTGRTSGSYGVLLLADLSKPEPGTTPWQAFDVYSAVKPDGNGVFTAHPRFANLAEADMPTAPPPLLPVTDAFTAAALSMADLHACFWKDAQAISDVCDSTFSFYRWFGPFNTAPVWNKRQFHHSAAARLKPGAWDAFVKLVGTMLENPSGEVYLNDEQIKSDIRLLPVDDPRVAAALLGVEANREAIYDYTQGAKPLPPLNPDAAPLEFDDAEGAAAAGCGMDWQQTLLRGDAHFGNMFFRVGESGDMEINHFDFQFAGPGNVAAELMYMLWTSVQHATGPWAYEYSYEFESGLLEAYHGRLLERGVTGFPLSQLRRDFKVLALIAAHSRITRDLDQRMTDHSTGVNRAWKGAGVRKDVDGMTRLDFTDLKKMTDRHKKDVDDHPVSRLHLFGLHRCGIIDLQRAADWHEQDV